jgi:hypothetical protein
LGLTSALFLTQKCAASAETVCGMRRIGVRLTPFSCAACAVLCSPLKGTECGENPSKYNLFEYVNKKLIKYPPVNKNLSVPGSGYPKTTSKK